MSRDAVFDTPAFFADIDAIRRYKRMSWRDLADETGMHSSLFTRLAQNKKPDVDNLCRLLDWGGLDITRYITRTTGLSAARIGDCDPADVKGRQQ